MQNNPLIASVMLVLGNYATFSGRAGRAEYWYWVLVVVITTIALALVEGMVLAPILGFEPFAPDAGQPLRLLFNLVVLIPSLAVTVRRLHDTDRSGWWFFMHLVPVIGSLVLLWWLTRPGDLQENRFGRVV